MAPPKLLPDHDTVLSSFNDLFTPGKTEYEMCCLCDGDIHAGSHVSMYCSDVNLAEGTDTSPNTWWPHRTYCEDCQEIELKLPHEGTTEVLYELYTPVNNPVEEYGIVTYSLAPHGIDWKPEEILETVSGIPLDEFTAKYAEEGESVSHAGIIDFLRLNDIDIRKLVDKNGDVQVTSEAKAALQERVNKNALRERFQS